MHHRPSFSPLGDLLALVLVVALVIAGVEWLGYDLGWRLWLACKLLSTEGVFTLGIVVGVGLLFFRRTRSAGAGLVLLAFGGSYALELLAPHTAGCPAAVFAPHSGGP